MMPPARKTVQLDGVGPFYYLEASDDDPLVFVPGWTMAASVFDAQAVHSARTHRVLVLEPRSPAQSVTTVGDNTCGQMGANIRAFVTALDLHDVILVTWSNAVNYGYAYSARGNE